MISRRHHKCDVPLAVDPIRSKIMRSVGREDTRPEMLVRRILHNLGFRFRLHRRDLPGTPDIVLPKYMTAIFVHGCFWHRHKNCSKATSPKTRVQFWTDKFEQNTARDRRNDKALKQAGWSVLVIWECETRRPVELRKKLAVYFSRGRPA
jgi:DNA mismatch endonuclease (patch repair protein)